MDNRFDIDNYDDSDHRADAPRQHRSFFTKCKYCNEPDLTWCQEEGKWRLYKVGKNAKIEYHSCSAYRKLIEQKLKEIENNG